MVTLSIFIFQSFIFLDTEGTPIQELAALEVDTNYVIRDVFHAFANTDEDDSFARDHIHGLNKTMLEEKGYPNEALLIEAFNSWLHRKGIPEVNIFANNCNKERKVLKLKNVYNFELLPWAERRYVCSHEIALRFKELCIPVNGHKCGASAHNSFRSARSSSPNPLSTIAKARHGHHCALYDALELYYESIRLL